MMDSRCAMLLSRSWRACSFVRTDWDMIEGSWSVISSSVVRWLLLMIIFVVDWHGGFSNLAVDTLLGDLDSTSRLFWFSLCILYSSLSALYETCHVLKTSISVLPTIGDVWNWWGLPPPIANLWSLVSDCIRLEACCSSCLPAIRYL